MTKLLSMTAAICIAVFVLFSVHPALAGDAEWRSCVGAVVSHAAKRKDPNYEHVARGRGRRGILPTRQSIGVSQEMAAADTRQRSSRLTKKQ